MVFLVVSKNGVVMKLSDIKCKNAKYYEDEKPNGSKHKLMDGEGLYLHVKPNGKYWHFKYRFNNKQKLLSFGVYPEISLKEAREKKIAARKILADGQDPSQVKKDIKQQTIENNENTFEAVSKKWHEKNYTNWTEEHANKIWRRLELHIFPYLGSKPIKDIKPLELLNVIQKIEDRGHTELSHKILQTCTVIFRYAIVMAKTDYNPAADLKGALKPHKTTHYPTISAKEIPNFYKKLELANTTEINKLAIKILLLVFLRQGELRKSKWEHIDFEAKEWRVPAEIMKMKDEHIIPLSHQTITLLKELHQFTGHSEYLFPSQHKQKNPYMSENTIGKVIKHHMGYDGKMVGHGVRALASTALNEHGFRTDVIERQLAHAERNKVRAAYNRAEYLDERRKMMQWWADYLDRAQNGGGNVLEGRFGNE